MLKIEKKRPNLKGEKIALTGKLASMARPVFVELLEKQGAHFSEEIDKEVSLLIFGANGWPFKADGRLTEKIRLANELNNAGEAIQVLSEVEFFRLFAFDIFEQNFTNLYSIGQLARILDISEVKIRQYMRHNLITPSKMQGRLPWFDYQALANLKSLKTLMQQGVEIKDLKEGIAALEKWLPSSENFLKTLGSHGQLVVSLNESVLTPEGQMLIDFEHQEKAQPGEVETALHDKQSAANAAHYFDLASKAEEEGQTAVAIKYYEKAVKADIYFTEAFFNLGNLLYACKQKALAANHFLRAVELEPDFVEGWNNLGNCLFDLKEEREAIRAFKKALDIQPDYADAHYNISFVLVKTGQLKEAKRHLIRYLAFDKNSSMADEVTNLLNSINSQL